MLDLHFITGENASQKGVTVFMIPTLMAVTDVQTYALFLFRELFRNPSCTNFWKYSLSYDFIDRTLTTLQLVYRLFDSHISIIRFLQYSLQSSMWEGAMIDRHQWHIFCHFWSYHYTHARFVTAKLCRHTVQMNFLASSNSNSENPNHCIVLFFGGCNKPSDHVNYDSGSIHLNGQGQVCRNNNREVPCLWLCANWAAVLITKEINTMRYFLTYSRVSKFHTIFSFI
jgi:hypothetical protein